MTHPSVTPSAVGEIGFEGNRPDLSASPHILLRSDGTLTTEEENQNMVYEFQYAMCIVIVVRFLFKPCTDWGGGVPKNGNFGMSIPPSMPGAVLT